MPPRFPELSQVRVIHPDLTSVEGFVVGYELRDGQWLYKLSIADPHDPGETFDNWYPESVLVLSSGTP